MTRDETTAADPDDATAVAPYTAYQTTVRSEWIDYNGHMNDAAYAQVLTDANECFLDALGLSASYREATGCGLFSLQPAAATRAKDNSAYFIAGSQSTR